MTKNTAAELIMYAKGCGCTWVEIDNSKSIEGTDIPELIYMQSIEDSISTKNPAFMFLYYLKCESWKIDGDKLLIKCNLK